MVKFLSILKNEKKRFHVFRLTTILTKSVDLFFNSCRDILSIFGKLRRFARSLLSVFVRDLDKLNPTGTICADLLLIVLKMKLKIKKVCFFIKFFGWNIFLIMKVIIIIRLGFCFLWNKSSL